MESHVMRWVPSFAFLLVGAGLHILPTLSRREIFFSVTVLPEFRDGTRARTILRQYRVAVWLVAIAGAVLIAAPAPIIAIPVFFLIAGSAWLYARTQALPYSAPPVLSRSASLVRRDARLPGGTLVALGPFMILVAAAVGLAVSWSTVPLQIPTRWMIDGSPEAWGTRVHALGVLGLGAFIVTSMLLIARAIVGATRQIAAAGPAAVSERRFKRVNAGYMVMCAYVTALTVTGVVLQPLLATSTSHAGRSIWIVMGVVLAMSVSMTAWLLRVGQGGQRGVRAGRVVGDGTPDSAWKGGLIYYNPSDPAWLVEKRIGFGWTLNFAHRLSWLILALFLLVFVVPAIVRSFR